jgi:hypothetical protein
MAAPQPTLTLLRRHLLATICGGLTLVVVAAFIYRFGVLDEKKQLLDQAQKDSDALHHNLRNSAELSEHLAALKTGLERLEGKLMRSDDVAAYQQYFFKLESDAGVKILRLQPLNSVRAVGAKPAGAYRPLAFDLTVEGAFADVLAFLRSMETGTRHFRMVSFSARPAGTSPGNAAGGTNVVTVALSLELLGSQ